MKKLLKYMKGYYRECVLSPLFKLFEALLELFVPLIVAQIIDVGIANNDMGYIVKMSLFMALLGLVGLGLAIVAQYFAARAAVGFSTRVRGVLFNHVMRLSPTELDALGGSTVVTRLTSDMNQVQNGVNMTLRLLLRSPFVVFGAMIMAFTVDVPSALVFAVIIPILAVVVFAIMLSTVPLYRRVQAKLDRILLLTRENLSGARVVRAFGREEKESEMFAESNSALTAAQTRVGRISALLNPLTFVLINAAILYLIYTGALRVEMGVLTQGAVIALYNYMSQILVELIKLANLIILMTKAVVSGRRVSAVLDIPTGIPEGESVPAPIPGAPLVKFTDVALTYRSAAAPALQNIDLTADSGEVIGIIGGTGSGKSTLVNLLWRAYDATEGELQIDGQPIANYPLAYLREQIGIVPQRAELFRGTIRENLKYGNENATDEELWAALESAQAASFVREKEGGLDHLCEAGGSNLSGGQRQRLTIARALCRRPRILILDDSASALDFATDAALRHSLRALDYKPTVFIVSQRTSSIRHADRILVLDDGCAVGCGTHDELLSSCAVYREIYESQYKKEDETDGN